jgi:hypothetical protein
LDHEQPIIGQEQHPRIHSRPMEAFEVEDHNEHAGKAHKPKKRHPWRNAINSDVAKWAKEKSEVSKANNFSIGKLPQRRG